MLFVFQELFNSNFNYLLVNLLVNKIGGKAIKSVETCVSLKIVNECIVISLLLLNLQPILTLLQQFKHLLITGFLF